MVSIEQLVRTIGGVAAAAIALTAMADEPALEDRAAAELLEEVVVVATREEAQMHRLPYTVHRIEREDIVHKSTRNLPQALRDVPGVMVQETSFGQGSPYIRGFTGFRNLFLIDGIRLNNPIFRDGPNQYWQTIDVHSLDRIEVVNGPTSALYGSDAIGGTVNVVTGDPFEPESRATYRYSTAEESNVLRLQYGRRLGDRLAARVGITGKDFGDLDGGSDVGRQNGVGYDELDVDMKLSAELGGGWRSDVYWSGVRQNNVPRTHRTVEAVSWHGTSLGSEIQRDLDQERTLAYVRLANGALDGFLDSASVTLSHSGMEEQRDRIRSRNRRDKQGFDIATVGFLTQLASETSLGRLVYGFDYYRSEVDSFSSRNAIQGPVGDDAEYSSVDLYLQDRVTLGERTELVLGIRHTDVDMDAKRVADPVTGEQIRVRDDWRATVGNINLSYAFTDELRGFVGVSEAFRAPNLSDTTRFDSSRTNEFEVAAPGLDPEEFLSYETGLKWRRGATNLMVSLFHTRIDDLIQRVPTGRVVDGEFEITKANVGDGSVEGVEIFADWALTDVLSLTTNVTWMDGEVDTFPTAAPVAVAEPIDRLMPLMGSVGLRGRASERLWWEGRVQFATRADELSSRDRRDTSRIPPGGTPGYTVVHAAAGYRLGPRTELIVGIDNVLDKAYRVHGSGTNMPGRNLMVTFESRF